MADLEQLKEKIALSEEAGRKAAEQHAALIDEYDTERVKAMDVDVVAEAESIGINPRNFDDTEHLQQAIDLVKESEENKATDQGDGNPTPETINQEESN